MTKYLPPVVPPRPGIHPAQIAAEQASLRAAARGEDSREAASKAYADTLKQMGEQPVIPD
jgi:hypothetical protein